MCVFNSNARKGCGQRLRPSCDLRGLVDTTGAGGARSCQWNPDKCQGLSWAFGRADSYGSSYTMGIGKGEIDPEMPSVPSLPRIHLVLPLLQIRAAGRAQLAEPLGQASPACPWGQTSRKLEEPSSCYSLPQKSFRIFLLAAGF